ncbi:peptidoglycan DD-metalloendopeptidase family protein [Methylonatrum kenyense]|uniref:peptidoglycan DD-metalloendopeptidase family protein n=1 Tax=Methylonatrum kenyense TaxID=455253 RepID=UPI0020C0B639|nr:peptidoglycan DD-metalloendopeptidase family protein [Methylonatrum kenyense]MCK8516407.1 peptidoglycan DD-metalloendopeptidase family protein [Methylonatrum kenyense]
MSLRLVLLLLCCCLLAACARDTYAPVSDRGGARGDSYTVSRGDTLYGIAFRHNVDYRDLARWNNIRSPYTIYPGQELRLAGDTRRTAQAGRPTRSAGGSQATGSSPSTPSRSNGAAGSREQTTSPPRRASTEIDWKWPTDGSVSKTFSADADGKQGINIGGSAGQAVRAAAPGRVVYSGSGLVGYGNLVIIKHDGDYLTAYGYNQELLVDEGAEVSVGQEIARMGRNGAESMLHFELRREGKPVDPLGYLPAEP